MTACAKCEIELPYDDAMYCVRRPEACALRVQLRDLKRAARAALYAIDTASGSWKEIDELHTMVDEGMSADDVAREIAAKR